MNQSLEVLTFNDRSSNSILLKPKVFGNLAKSVDHGKAISKTSLSSYQGGLSNNRYGNMAEEERSYKKWSLNERRPIEEANKARLENSISVHRNMIKDRGLKPAGSTHQVYSST